MIVRGSPPICVGGFAVLLSILSEDDSSVVRFLQSWDISCPVCVGGF